MNTPLIEEAITGHWGERCREPEPGCPACNAWHELDTLKAKSDHCTSDEAVLVHSGKALGDAFRQPASKQQP